MRRDEFRIKLHSLCARKEHTEEKERCIRKYADNILATYSGDIPDYEYQTLCLKFGIPYDGGKGVHIRKGVKRCASNSTDETKRKACDDTGITVYTHMDKPITKGTHAIYTEGSRYLDKIHSIMDDVIKMIDKLCNSIGDTDIENTDNKSVVLFKQMYHLLVCITSITKYQSFLTDGMTRLLSMSARVDSSLKERVKNTHTEMQKEIEILKSKYKSSILCDRMDAAFNEYVKEIGFRMCSDDILRYDRFVGGQSADMGVLLTQATHNEVVQRNSVPLLNIMCIDKSTDQEVVLLYIDEFNAIQYRDAAVLCVYEYTHCRKPDIDVYVETFLCVGDREYYVYVDSIMDTPLSLCLYDKKMDTSNAYMFKIVV